MFARSNFYLLVFSTFLFCATLNAQLPDLYFKNLTVTDGISDNIITCLYEDKKGFLWIGTSYGLNRYDGNYFQTFLNEEGNSNSLSGNVIVDIIEDDDGIFWIITKDGGITRYDPSAVRDKQFTQFKNDPKDSSSVISNRMTAICELNKDYIIISAENMNVGFINKHDLSITYSQYTDTIHSPIDPHYAKSKPDRNSWIHKFIEQDGHIFISYLATSGIKVFNKNFEPPTHYKFNLKAGSVPSFYIDGDTIWLASWGKGLFIQENPLYTQPGKPVEQQMVLDIDAELSFIIPWNNNTLVAGTRESGLLLIDKKNYAFKKFSHDRGDNFTLPSNRVNCILKDSRGILWVGTPAGLSKYNPVEWQFTAHQLISETDKEIYQFSIFEYGDGTLGICTSNGIYKYNPETHESKLYEYYYKDHKLHPTGVTPLNNGKYYMTTESNTFFFDPVTNKIEILAPENYYYFESKTYHKFDPFRGGSYQVYQTLLDTIDGTPLHFFRTIGWGIGVYNEKSKVYSDFFRLTDTASLSSNFVRVLFKDSKNNIWAGTSEGLNKWQRSLPLENNFTKYFHSNSNPGSISHNTITGMYEDDEGTLWISTVNGINEFDGKTFLHYNKSVSGNTQMYGLYADDKGNLWTGVRNGFEVFNMQEKTFHFLPIINNTYIIKNPATILMQKSGTWYYGAGNNIISFEPGKCYFETSFPEIYLREFSVFDNKIFHTPEFETLRFNHSDNFITIEFSSLQLSQPSTVKYQYQLSGLNNDWIETGNPGKISFTSLPPGDYVLNIKVANPQGRWSNSIQLVSFVILKPFWQQIWFFILCGIITAGIIYIIIRYREHQFLKLQSIRNKIANDLHDDVGSALSTINLYSEVAKIKSDHENADLKDILDKISNTSIEMQENMNQARLMRKEIGGHNPAEKKRRHHSGDSNEQRRPTDLEHLADL